eukprot:11836469-Alexandrium_andersonii.AAC.1
MSHANMRSHGVARSVLRVVALLRCPWCLWPRCGLESLESGPRGPPSCSIAFATRARQRRAWHLIFL